MTSLAATGFGLAVASFLSPQQINTVDLSTPPVRSEESEKRPLPGGCKELSGGIIEDGWVKPDEHRPRHTAVQLIETNDLYPAIGSELKAVVQLRNDDTQPILIPWSTDPNILDFGQQPDDMQWEGGTFEFTLSDQDGNRVDVKSLTGWLNGSKFSPGSQLTLKPGQSITATVKLTAEQLYPIEPLRLKEGEWQLSAKRHQVGREWHINDCAVSNGYFQYEEYYAQQNPPLVIHIYTSEPTKPIPAAPH